MRHRSIISEKSYEFAKEIVRFYQHISTEKKEFVLSKQVLRSGTSICANVREGDYGQSKRDFIHKMSISMKEASETVYWLNLLNDTGYCDAYKIEPLLEQADEVMKILTSILRTAKSK